MNEVKIFENPQFGSVRTAMINDEPWFVAKEIASVLGYTDTAQAIRKHVDEEDKKHLDYQTAVLFFQGGQNDNPENQGCQNDNLEFKVSSFGMYVINESGLYALILNSKLPAAKSFKRWVTSEVLPSIRKTGSYSTPKTKALTMQDEMYFIEAACRMLNMNEVSKLGMIEKTGKALGATGASFLPKYVKSEGQLLSAKALLKLHWPGVSSVSFNQLLVAEGILEDKTRPSSNGGAKKFKSITQYGSKWGENHRNPNASGMETQPLYYADKFPELVQLIKSKVSVKN